MLHLCAHDISKQRKRLGGNWCVDFVVYTRKQRDDLRKILGPDLIFIVLNISKEYEEKRLKERGEDDGFIDFVLAIFQTSEAAGDDEENAYNVTITEDMSPNDVVKKILEIVNEISPTKPLIPLHQNEIENSSVFCCFSRGKQIHKITPVT